MNGKGRVSGPPRRTTIAKMAAGATSTASRELQPASGAGAQPLRLTQKRTNSLKPPKIMREPSKGMEPGSVFRRGSAMTALLMRSRSRRER